MAARSSAVEPTEIIIEPMKMETVPFALIGTSPLICHAMSDKAKWEILWGGNFKTPTEKQRTIKHRPLEEFRSSAYMLAEGPTLLAMPATAVKGAMLTAALELPATKKAQIGRLVHVIGDYVPVYGLPKLHMAVTRQSGMTRAPDVRTRVIVPEWCALVQIRFVTPTLTVTAIASLLNAGGVVAGIGDFRQEKGVGNFGLFECGTWDDARVTALIKAGGREAQEKAMEKPVPYDEEVKTLLELHAAEIVRRGRK